MNLTNAEEGKEYIIRQIETDDEEMDAFLFSLGCYSGEPITVVSRRRGGCVVSIKDGRYNIDNELAAAFGLTKVAALAYLMFNLFTPPCFAALGAMNSEINDRKWFWGGVALQFATGYSVAFLVYQIGTLITTGGVGTGAQSRNKSTPCR